MTVDQVMFKSLEAKVRYWILQHEQEEAPEGEEINPEV